MSIYRQLTTPGVSDVTLGMKTEVPENENAIYITFEDVFINLPVVVASVESTEQFEYSLNIRDLSTSGYLAYLSDFVVGTGVFIHSLIKKT